ncbi:hypothetical protein BDZ89DRAFT_1065016, partial [Hymenopellis radicata]
ERRVLCDRCSSIVTSEIPKCNDLQASVSAALWQASYFPSQSDLDDIQTRLDELYSQWDAYDNEIVRVRTMLDMLVANRQALCFDVGASHSFTDLFNDKTRAVTTPLRLAKVCHLWRGIIFQNPLLWTYQSHCLRDATDLVDIAPIYEKESFPHSLDVLVYSRDLYSDCDSMNGSSDRYNAGDLHYLRRRRTKEMQSLMEKLDCDRWRRLSWDREGLQCDWSALEVLEIHPCEIDLSEGSPFACAPQLRTLRLMASDYYYPLPWEQLEELWISYDDYAVLVNLCSARSLRRLTLQRHFRQRLGDIYPEILACLEEVRFVDGGISKFLQEMDVLGSMGSLTSLELSSNTPAFSLWTPAAATLVVELAPCPSLRNLIIRDSLIHNDTLIPLIRALENLRSLVIIEPRFLLPPGKSKLADVIAAEKTIIEGGVITSDVLDVLRGHRLEHLEIVLAEDSSLLGRQGDVLDVIEYLYTISLKSAVVGIRGGVELQPPTLERMKELRRAGLQIWSA